MVPLFGRRSWVSQLKCRFQVLIIAVVVAIKLDTLFGENDLLLLFFLRPLAFLISCYLSLTNIACCSCVSFLILHFDVWGLDLLMFLIFILEVLIELVAWVDDKWEDNHHWTVGVHSKEHVG